MQKYDRLFGTFLHVLASLFNSGAGFGSCLSSVLCGCVGCAFSGGHGVLGTGFHSFASCVGSFSGFFGSLFTSFATCG
jgi:hypothetical protein